MNRAQQIAATLTDILEGDPWYASCIKAMLHGVTAVAAASQPLAGAHTIWEIATHMDAWNHVCLRRASGETVAEPPVNFPAPDEITPEEWRSVQVRLDNSCRQVIARAGKLTDAELAVIVPGKDYTVDFLMEGMGHHWIYHSGQIAMLRRGLGIHAETE